LTHDTSPSAEPAADGEAPPEAFLATLLAGFGLALADATTPALHRALDLFARALLLDETRPEPHLGLAICYANLGDDRRAIRHFDTCLKRGFGAGDYPELVYEYDDTDGQTWVVEIGLDRVLVWRAACHLALESVEPARSDLARVSDSGDRDVQAEIAVLWTKIRLAEGDLEGAQRQLSHALGLDPDQPDAHFVRGRIHEHRGNLRAALQAYSRAIRLDTEAPEFRIARARVYLASGQQRHAETDLRRAEALLKRQLPQP